VCRVAYVCHCVGWLADSLADSEQACRSYLSCIGLVITLGEVVEDGLGVVGDARGRGDLLGAEADGGGP
jgi:hypothetical protein